MTSLEPVRHGKSQRVHADGRVGALSSGALGTRVEVLSVAALIAGAVCENAWRPKSPPSSWLRHSSCCTAGDTCNFGRKIGLEPRATLIESPRAMLKPSMARLRPRQSVPECRCRDATDPVIHA